MHHDFVLNLSVLVEEELSACVEIDVSTVSDSTQEKCNEKSLFIKILVTILRFAFLTGLTCNSIILWLL